MASAVFRCGVSFRGVSWNFRFQGYNDECVATTQGISETYGTCCPCPSCNLLVAINGVSIHGGTPKSSIFHRIFHYKPSSYWGSSIYGNTLICCGRCRGRCCHMSRYFHVWHPRWPVGLSPLSAMARGQRADSMGAAIGDFSADFARTPPSPSGDEWLWNGRRPFRFLDDFWENFWIVVFLVFSFCFCWSCSWNLRNSEINFPAVSDASWCHFPRWRH